MTNTRLTLLGRKLAPTGEVNPKPNSLPIEEFSVPPEDISPLAEEPPSGSGLTPPSSPQPFARQPITPTRSSSLLQVNGPSRSPFSTAIAETIILGTNNVQSISPTPVIVKLEKACEERDTEHAIAIVDEERRKGRRGEIEGDKVNCSISCLLRLMIGHTSVDSAIPASVSRVLSTTRSNVRKSR